MTDTAPSAGELWNEREYLRLLEPMKDASPLRRRRELWIRPAMRLYAWVLWITPVISWFGLRHLTPNGLRILFFLGAATGAGLSIRAGNFELTAICAVLLVGSVLEARGAGRSRVVIDGFTGLTTPESLSSPRIAEMLRVELARLGDLFQSVGDQRAVSSGIGPKRALDATLSVDSVASSLQAAVSAESKVTVGPLSIPWRLVIAIADRLISPPRITGSLHADRSGLVITAQQGGLRGFSWRVPPDLQTPTDGPARTRRNSASATADLDSVSHTLRELALRIFTDLALGRSVRWQASSEFVKGLDHVRACLRAPVDRKVNLREAEKHFLKTLSEDEDFPHAYYNLGVVYNELFTLAWSSGRTVEARNHLRAAEISFERAIERDPQRWENYYALAQTHFQNCRFSIVIDLCNRMRELKHPGVVNRAKTRELYASALLATALRDGDPRLNERRRLRDGLRSALVNVMARVWPSRFTRKDHRGLVARANSRARRAVFWSTIATLRGRLLPGFFEPEDELAAACLQTFGFTQAIYVQSNPELWKRVEMIYKRARSLPKHNAELRVELGLLALGAQNADLAVTQLQGAVRSDPARPLYTAALAAAVAERAAAQAGGPTTEDRRRVEDLCRRAAQSMTRAYSPARDGVATDLITRASARLGDPDLSALALVLGATRYEANRLLAGPVETDPAGPEEPDEPESERDGGSIVSAAFLQALPSTPTTDQTLDKILDQILDKILDEYGVAIQQARKLLGVLRGEEELDSPLGQSQLQRLALTEAERATSLNPLSVLAWMTLGDIHQELADYANAKESWTNAQTQDPDNPALYDRIGTSSWHLAFRGRSRPDQDKLLDAREQFDKAMLLYETGTLKDQIRTRYRLGKLHVALNDFDAALAQFQIVETGARRPPIVGWVMLGLAYLEKRDYAEAEYYFERVIECGAFLDSGEALPRLASGAIDPTVQTWKQPKKWIGTRTDEQRHWPLAIVRAWGYLGLALSYAQRDGDLDKAKMLTASARTLAELPDLEPGDYRIRVPAACDDCEGYILYKEREYDDAKDKLELAVARSPYSRTYLNLAWTYVALGHRQPNDYGGCAHKAARCVDHAVNLDPDHETTDEVSEIRRAITALQARPASNGAPPTA